MANAVYQAFKPPVLSKVSPFAGGNEAPSTSTQPEMGRTDSRPGPKSTKSAPTRPVPEESVPKTSIPETSVREETVEVSDMESDKTDSGTPEEKPPPPSLEA